MFMKIIVMNACALNEEKREARIPQHHWKDKKKQGSHNIGCILFLVLKINLNLCNHKSADNLNIQLNNQPKQAVLRISLAIYNHNILNRFSKFKLRS